MLFTKHQSFSKGGSNVVHCRRIRWQNHSKWREKMYEFESRDFYEAGIFLKILNNMNLQVVEEYVVPEYISNSSIKFLATRAERIRAEYIFRRYCDLSRWYLLDLDGYQKNQWKFMENGYMIY